MSPAQEGAAVPLPEHLNIVVVAGFGGLCAAIERAYDAVTELGRFVAQSAPRVARPGRAGAGGLTGYAETPAACSSARLIGTCGMPSSTNGAPQRAKPNRAYQPSRSA